MKQYALFAGEDYYPSGGWRDFVGWFDTVEAAQARILLPIIETSYSIDRTISPDWGHIVDLESGLPLCQFDTDDGWLPWDHEN